MMWLIELGTLQMAFGAFWGTFMVFIFIRAIHIIRFKT